MSVTSGGANQFTAYLAETTLQLTAIVGRIFAHGSGREDKFVAKCRWNRPTGFEQRLKMRLGGLLEMQDGRAAIAAVRVAAWEKAGLGDPHTILVPPHTNLC